MANKKKIVICWNSNGYVDKLNEAFAQSKDYSVTVFTSFEFFDKLGKSAQERRMKLREYDGFVVLCELQWNHKATSADFSEFQGIYFVQDYLRRELGLKAPVVFTSFMDAKEIVKQKPDYSIIMTPALQHEFVRLPSKPENLVEPFANMRFMSDTELVYTQMQYCGIIGLLRQIKHNSEGRKADEQDVFRRQVRYVIKKQFPGDASRIKDLESAKDVSVFCESLMKELSLEETDLSVSKVIDLDYACDRESEQLRTLILEDDPNDVNVNRFIEYIVEQNKIYKKKGKCYLFQEPVIVSTKEDFNTSLSRFVYHIVICDIEIREGGKLVSLGFNIAVEAAKHKTKPLYYIVTNVTRSFYDQIKLSSIKRIHLKKEVFGTEKSIARFLYGIKEVNVQRKEDEADSKSDCEIVFDRLYEYVKKNDFALFEYRWKNGKFKADISSYDELESVVKEESVKLIKQFLNYFVEIKQRENNGVCFYTTSVQAMKENNFAAFNVGCEAMREHIKSIMAPNEKFLGEFLKSIIRSNNPYKDPTKDHLQKFIIRLILRRFFLYVKRFMEQYYVYDSAIRFAKKNDGNKNRIFTCSDIACRAINVAYKDIWGEEETVDREFHEQGRVLERILFISSDRNPEYLTIEEEEFLSCLKKKKDKAFPLDKKVIGKLNFVY